MLNDPECRYRPEPFQLAPKDVDFDKRVLDRFREMFFEAWAQEHRPWLGTSIIKYPTDMFLYQMILTKCRPDVLIETGSYLGGSALFYATIMDLMGHGQVLSIDVTQRTRPIHPRLTFRIGRSTAYDTLEFVKEFVGNKTCMVTLDSNHLRSHVKRELHFYSPYVSVGQYLVVEDTFPNHKINIEERGPKAALDSWLPNHPEFIMEPLENAFAGISQNIGGYLKRI
jgi:cephalosporin hydroxylase